MAQHDPAAGALLKGRKEDGASQRETEGASHNLLDAGAAFAPQLYRVRKFFIWLPTAG